MKRLILAGLLCCVAAAARAAAPAVSTGTVRSSTATFVAPSPSTIYTTEKLRDPFTASAGGRAGAKPYDPADFNIHNLSLRGMMKDRAADYALFTDTVYAATFILRKGKLHDPKGKPIASVKGSMDLKKKTAYLETSDGDVQVFTLGQDGID